jgi:ubiquinone biosynthesis protein COQ4
MNSATEQHRQLFNHFIDVVQSPDGDFDSIGRLANNLNQPSSLQTLVERLSQSVQAKQAFQHRPRLGAIDLQQFYQLPKNSLGYRYAEHVTHHVLKHGLTPFHENPLEANNDTEFLVAHLTETHELWHLLTGINTTIIGEVQLQAFYAAQLDGYRFWLALLAKNLLKSAVFDLDVSNEYMNALTRGWTLGKQAKSLFGIEWETQWERPFHQVRAGLNLAPIKLPTSYRIAA